MDLPAARTERKRPLLLIRHPAQSNLLWQPAGTDAALPLSLFHILPPPTTLCFSTRRTSVGVVRQTLQPALGKVRGCASQGVPPETDLQGCLWAPLQGRHWPPLPALPTPRAALAGCTAGHHSALWPCAPRHFRMQMALLFHIGKFTNIKAQYADYCLRGQFGEVLLIKNLVKRFFQKDEEGTSYIYRYYILWRD